MSTLSLLRRIYISHQIPTHIYCSVLWRPHLKKGHRIVGDSPKKGNKLHSSWLWYTDYFTRLKKLKLLPLMYYNFEIIIDIMFAVKHLKEPKDHFNHVAFSSVSTRSSSSLKMSHTRCSNNYSRFNCLPHLWKSIVAIKQHLTTCMMVWCFLSTFSVANSCSYHFMCPCMCKVFSFGPQNYSLNINHYISWLPVTWHQYSANYSLCHCSP